MYYLYILRLFKIYIFTFLKYFLFFRHFHFYNKGGRQRCMAHSKRSKNIYMILFYNILFIILYLQINMYDRGGLKFYTNVLNPI